MIYLGVFITLLIFTGLTVPRRSLKWE